MRDLVQAYNPHKLGRKDLPCMVTSMMPSIKSILYPESWDFIMWALMPALVGYLSPSGWQQIYITLQWMLYSQTEPISLLDPVLQGKSRGIITNDVPQELPRGWTPQLIGKCDEIGINSKMQIEYGNPSDFLTEYLERLLIMDSTKSKEHMEELVEHVISTDNINSGRVLKWLSCDSSIIDDSISLRHSYIRLYKSVFSFGGEIYRTIWGPRIVIPVDTWKSYDEMDGKSQVEFTRVTYMQAHQYSKRMWNTAIRNYNYNDWVYFNDLMWDTGGYRNLNSIFYDECKRTNNWELKDTYLPSWIGDKSKPDIFLPLSDTVMNWDSYLQGYIKSKNTEWKHLDLSKSGGWPEHHEGAWMSPVHLGDKAWGAPIPNHNDSAWGSPIPNSNNTEWGSPNPQTMDLNGEEIPVIILRKPDTTFTSPAPPPLEDIEDSVIISSDSNSDSESDSECSSCDEDSVMILSIPLGPDHLRPFGRSTP
jgi:hypothetical protein